MQIIDPSVSLLGQTYALGDLSGQLLIRQAD